MVCYSIEFCSQKCNTVEALVSRLPQDVKKVSVTGAGRLQECKNTEFDWELRKTGLGARVMINYEL